MEILSQLQHEATALDPHLQEIGAEIICCFAFGSKLRGKLNSDTDLLYLAEYTHTSPELHLMIRLDTPNIHAHIFDWSQLMPRLVSSPYIYGYHEWLQGFSRENLLVLGAEPQVQNLPFRALLKQQFGID